MDNGFPGHGGCTMIQISHAKPSQLIYGVPLSAKQNVPDTIKDFIRNGGKQETWHPTKSEDSAKQEDDGRRQGVGKWANKPANKPEDKQFVEMVGDYLKMAQNGFKGILDHLKCN